MRQRLLVRATIFDSIPDVPHARPSRAVEVSTKNGQILQFAGRAAPKVPVRSRTRQADSARPWLVKCLDVTPVAFTSVLFVVGFGACLLRLA
jgi:hypothetical protein